MRRRTNAVLCLCMMLRRLAQSWSRQAHRELDKAGKIHEIELESGDVVLFGGVSRMIHHTITKVYKGTTPSYLSDILVDEARLNLTFRHAPDIVTEDFALFDGPPSKKGNNKKSQKDGAGASKATKEAPALLQ